VRLDKNLRKSKAEEKVLGRKGVAWVARPPEAQLSRGARPFWSNGHQRDFHGTSREELSRELRKREVGGQGVRNPNAMDVDRGES